MSPERLQEIRRRASRGPLATMADVRAELILCRMDMSALLDYTDTLRAETEALRRRQVTYEGKQS